jgi:hypothetical protein
MGFDPILQGIQRLNFGNIFLEMIFCTRAGIVSRPMEPSRTDGRSRRRFPKTGHRGVKLAQGTAFE